MKKITLLFAAACFLFAGLSAAEGDKASADGNGSAEKTVKPVLIRHGFVYSAEISKIKPNFQTEVKGDQPPFPDAAWAAVMLKLPKNRGVSRFDYEIKTPSGSYPCLAVALGAEPYSQERSQWTIEAKKELEGKFVRMLFAFPAADLMNEPLQDLQLVFKMRDSVCQPHPIPFRILPDDQPLSANPQLLSENGNCGLSWLEMHPEFLPSLEDDPSGDNGKKEDEKAGEKAAVKTEKKAAAGEEKSSDKAAAKTEKKAAAGEEKSSDKAAAVKAEKKAPAEEEEKSSDKASAVKAEKKASAEEEEKSSDKAAAKAEKKAPAEEEEKSSDKAAAKAEKKASAKGERSSGKADRKASAKGEKGSDKASGKNSRKAGRGKNSRRKGD